MENLDGTVIATAVPRMARSFGVSPVDLNIGITAYLLALAVFIPISGWLADRFGARTIFGSAIAIFTGSSILKDIAKFARGLSQVQRRALGIRRTRQGKYPAPTQPTFCRLLQRVDARKVVSCRLAPSENGKTIASNNSLLSPSIQSYIFHLTLKTYM
jgi:MFS family permease